MFAFPFLKHNGLIQSACYRVWTQNMVSVSFGMQTYSFCFRSLLKIAILGMYLYFYTGQGILN